MNKKLIHIFREISNAILLAGLIILVIGWYYLIVKSGIPYQDPSVEMQIQYAINDGIGSVLSRAGFILALCGGIVRVVVWRVGRD